MPESGYLIEVIVILLASVISVLLFQRLQLGSVLGYLVAGTVIGPTGLGLVSDLEGTRALAEFGVVFLLFTVGLELPFERIRLMRGRTFGLGAAQVIVTSVAIAMVALLIGQGGAAAVAIGAGLALSSTAIVLQVLSERGDITTRFGRSAFAVLLVQDLAVGPFLVCVLALGGAAASIPAALGVAALKVAVAVLAILGIGRLVLRHAVLPVAQLRDREIFAALTLLVVLATATLTHLAGLSMAFGAFLTGMLFADTHYRHQVGAVILPFRGLLLGLFFVTVGMSVDLDLIWREGWTVALLLVLLLFGKGALLAGLAWLFGTPGAQALNLGILLAQGGEFAFVLLGVGMASGALGTEDGQMLLVVVALTMVLTPFLGRLGQVVSDRIERREAVHVEDLPEDAEPLSGHVVIAGYGRVGQAVAARLEAADVPYIAVDLDPHRIAQARQRGLPVFFGDATRPEILDALDLGRARSMVVTVDGVEAALQLVAMVCYIFPDLAVYARARDSEHARELKKLGAHAAVPELVETGFRLAGSILDAVEDDIAGERAG
jgi:CPA2 family monovalent cation:H+ antiporter-2